MHDSPVQKTVRLILPTPPGLNDMYFTRVIVPKSGRKPFVQRGPGKAAVKYKARVARAAVSLVPIVGDVWLNFRWYRPRRVGDLDGIFKIVMDSLTGYAYADDKQVKRITAERFDDAVRPRVEVEIRAMGLC